MLEKRELSFVKLKSPEVQEMFGLRRIFKEANIEGSNWIIPEKEGGIPNPILVQMEQLSFELLQKYQIWNETELLMYFIGPFLRYIPFNSDKYSLFNNRPLSAVINGVELKGRVDGMVASGVSEPRKPYFFLQEYKQVKGIDADPLGQVLGAMLVAQALNKDNDIIYGCFIIGPYWRFVSLKGKEYFVGKSYDASDFEGIQGLWRVLLYIQNFIEKKVNELKE